jgi:hypothetical protein
MSDQAKQPANHKYAIELAESVPSALGAAYLELLDRLVYGTHHDGAFEEVRQALVPAVQARLQFNSDIVNGGISRELSDELKARLTYAEEITTFKPGRKLCIYLTAVDPALTGQLMAALYAKDRPLLAGCSVERIEWGVRPDPQGPMMRLLQDMLSSDERVNQYAEAIERLDLAAQSKKTD